MDDSIRVEHGDDLENEVLPQFPSLLTVGDQELDDTVADIGADGLSWVDSCCNNDIGLLQLLV